MINFEALFIVLALACVGLAVGTRNNRRRIALLEDLAQRQAASINRLESDFAALLGCARRIGDRIGDTERTERTLQKQIDTLRFTREEQVAVQHAMKLIASGHEMNEVTRICELSEGEVEILQNLSRYRSAA